MPKHQPFVGFTTPFTNAPVLIDPHEVIAIAEETRQESDNAPVLIISLVFLRGGAMVGVVGGAEEVRASLDHHRHAHTQGDRHGW